MMILRQILMPLCALLVYLWIAFGFVVVPPPATGTCSSSQLYERTSPSNTREDSENEIGDSVRNESAHFSSARATRIALPWLLTTSLVLNIGCVPPAHAGIGTVIPFDETLKKEFRGSIATSTVLLRLRSTLRKRGYFQNKAAVATLKPIDELGTGLAREFGNDQLIPLSSSNASTLNDYLQNYCPDKKSLVLYGQDISISTDGAVSDIQGNDLKSSEAFLMESLALKAPPSVSEVTLVGGIIIHRTKSGTRKDAGEDCFLPMAVSSIKNGVVTDLFEEVFGDLPTRRQSVRLPG